jgi:hypothetical protein
MLMMVVGVRYTGLQGTDLLIASNTALRWANFNAPVVDIPHCTTHRRMGMPMLFVYYWMRVQLLTEETLWEGHHCIDLFATIMLLDRGARLLNFELDTWLPAIPDWVTTFIESRSNCRNAAIVIIGMHKCRRTNVTGNNDINVLRLISKHIWSTRMDSVWVRAPVETKKL